jgi:hypothetical protein
MNKKNLILKIAERLIDEKNKTSSYNEIAEIVLTYSEGWNYEGEQMIELIDEIISVKENIFRSLNSTQKDLQF